MITEWSGIQAVVVGSGILLIEMVKPYTAEENSHFHMSIILFYTTIFLTSMKMKLFEIIYKNNYDFHRIPYWTITFSMGFQRGESIGLIHFKCYKVCRPEYQIPTKPLHYLMITVGNYLVRSHRCVQYGVINNKLKK